MKFFVTGVNGQLGHDVMNEIQNAVMRALALMLRSNTRV